MFDQTLAVMRHTDVGVGDVHKIVREVVDELRIRLDALVDAGVLPDRVALDLGLGFGKRPSTTGS